MSYPHDPKDYMSLLQRTLVLKRSDGVPPPVIDTGGPASSDVIEGRYPQALSASMSMLAHRIGEGTVRHLLSQTMLWPLPNDCVFQFSGPPPPRPARSSNLPACPAPRVRGLPPPPLPTDVDESGHMNVPHEISSNKRPRLSSWRRRKATTLARKAAEVQATDDLLMDSPEPAPIAVAVPVPPLPLPQPPPPQVPEPVPSRRCAVIVPTRRQMRVLIRSLVRRHRRTSYHKLLCTHLPPHPPAAAVSAVTWAHVHNFTWAVGAAVIPTQLLGSRHNVRALLAAAARTGTLASGVRERRVSLPAQLTERLHTTEHPASAPPTGALAVLERGRRTRAPSACDQGRKRCRPAVEDEHPSVVRRSRGKERKRKRSAAAAASQSELADLVRDLDHKRSKLHHSVPPLAHHSVPPLAHHSLPLLAQPMTAREAGSQAPTKAMRMPRASRRSLGIAFKGRRGKGARHAACARRRLRSLGQWLVLRLLLPSLRRTFVCKSPQRYADALSYSPWPRGMWRRAFRRACRKVRRASLYPLSAPEAYGLLTDPERSSSCATLQLLPKGRGDFRTIHNLSRAVRLPKRWRLDAREADGAPTLAARGALHEPVNTALAHLLPLLNSLRRRLPSALATSLLGLSEVHVRWRHFVAERRHLAPDALLRFSSTDLTGCFDTIAQPRLFQAIQFALRLLLTTTAGPPAGRATAAVPATSAATATAMGGALVSRSAARAPALPPPPRVLIPRSFRVYRPSAGGLVARTLTEVCGGRLVADPLAAAARLAASGAAHGALFVESATVRPQASRLALAQMREHVFCNVVALDGQFLVQRMGVPQGSVLSSLFCSLHYGAYEHAILARYLPHRAALGYLPHRAALESDHQGALGTAVRVRAAPAAPATAEPHSHEPHSHEPHSHEPHSLQLQLRLIDDTLHVQTLDATLTAAHPSSMPPPEPANPIASLEHQLSSFGSVINPSKVRAYPATARPSIGARLAMDAAVEAITDTTNATTNADADADDVHVLPPGMCTDAQGRHFFPWCGWLIDVATCEVRPHLGKARLLAAREHRPRRGSVSLARWLALACKGLKPKLHRAFVDPQLNSGLVVRRNIFHAFLHALLSSHLGQQDAAPAALTRALEACVLYGSRVARTHQRRAVQMAPHGRCASTLLAGCEVEYLGWAAVSVICQHRPATLGAPALRRRIRRRLTLAEQRCVQLAEPCMPLLATACDAQGLIRLG